jgi:Ion channel
VIRAYIRRLEASHSYGLLLGLILISLVFQLSAPDARGARFVLVGLQALTLMLALWTSRAKDQEVRLAGYAAVVAVAAAIALVVTNDDNVSKGGLLIVGMFMVLLAPVAIAHGVYRSIGQAGGVTLQAAFGVLCIYLLLGMLFGFAYGVVAVVQDSALFTDGTDGNLQDHLYFSFTTLTTTGYGDLSPAGDLARALAILEALTGQLYLVTVVAVIVSNLRPRRNP